MSEKGKNGDLGRLKGHEAEIMNLNEQILALLDKRQNLAAKVGRIRQQEGLEGLDPAQEEHIIESLATGRGKNLGKRAVRSIFKEIFSAACAVQNPLTVSYLGPETTFSHQAALRLFGRSATFRPLETIEDVFANVERGDCQRGVVPVENAFAGSLHDTLDLFRKYDLRICAESLLRVRYNLLTNAYDLGKIVCLYAHPKAVEQCKSWLLNHLPEIAVKKVESSSKAAIMASEDPEAAALGGHLSAKTYGVKILAEDIEDHPDNVTRFFAVSRNDCPGTGNDKTTILFSVNHRPGALYEALKVLAKRKINMSKIESRPLRTRGWEYLFFIDIEGHRDDHEIELSLSKMKDKCEEFKIIGSYPTAKSPWP